MSTIVRPGNVIRMGGQDYLDIAAIAARLGVLPSSVQTYHTRAGRRRRAGTSRPGDFPPEDARFGQTPVWCVATIDAWISSRPGVSTEAATEARRRRRDG